MKICYLGYHDDTNSGWGRYTHELVSAIKKSGCKAFLLSEDPLGIARCDIVHALDVYPYGVCGYFAALFARKKLVISAQGTYAIEPLYKAKTAFLSRRALNSADAVIAISNFTKSELLKKARPKRVEIINHGIDLNLFHAERMAGSQDFILSVGALKYRKGYHISIPAFALAKKKIPHLKYKVVGNADDANYFNQLKTIAEKCNVLHDVEFISGISDKELRKLYQSAKLFVLVSVNIRHSFEGFGLVFLEAAAAGLPVIGTLGNGIEDAVKNDYNGILVEQGNIAETAQAICEILNSESAWQRMSENSHRWAQEHSLEKMAAQYIALYKNLL